MGWGGGDERLQVGKSLLLPPGCLEEPGTEKEPRLDRLRRVGVAAQERFPELRRPGRVLDLRKVGREREKRGPGLSLPQPGASP